VNVRHLVLETWPDLLRRFWMAFSGVSVRTKIMGIVLSLVLLLGLTVTFQVRVTMRHTLMRELEERGASIGGELAARSTDLVLTNNLFALHELLRDSLAYHEEVRYAFIVDPDNRLLVHSFDGGFPPDLLSANAARPDDRYHLGILDTEEGLIWDFAVPIFEGRAGTVRLGLTERKMRETVAATTQRLLLSTALASLGGVAGAYLLAWALTRPVQALVGVTRAVGQGKLDVKAPSWFDDEIGHLGAAFNQMVDDLAQPRQQSDAYNRLLLRRNRALAALNAVARAVSGPLTLEEVLERALGKVLEVTGLRAGWTCLLDDEGRCSRLSTFIGLAPEIARREAEVCLTRCAARRVLHESRPIVVSLVSTCPVAEADLGDGRRPNCHVAVPLVARSKVLGVLSIASADPGCYSSDDLELLGAIGRQLGVAVENARLWEEVRRKEALRGQLLEKVISAQEEERKRIARELHDETGQSLTSLLVGLKALEASDNLAQVRQGLQDLKAIAASTLEAVHDLAVELRPSLLDDLGLVAALQRYMRDYAARFNIVADFQTVGLDSHRLAPQVEITLYRIIQEAMINAARHAAAGQVSVLLERRGDSVVAIVEDDGQGFDVKDILNSEMRRRLGLYGMEERATLVGGRLTIESTPGSGTAVFVEVPL